MSVRCFPNASGFWSSAVRISFSRREIITFSDLREESGKAAIVDHDSDLLDAAGIMMDFFKQPRASVQIVAVLIFELFGFF